MLSSLTFLRCLANSSVRCTVALAVMGWLMFASVAIGADRASNAADRPPEGISTSDWSSIRAAYEANRHAAFAVDGGWQARNPGQQWRTQFDWRGFETTPDGGGWSWGLELVSYGRRGAECNPSRAPGSSEGVSSLPVCVQADGSRVEYKWDDTLTEWYVNDRRGLEHGYTVHQRPIGIRAVASAQRSLAARAEARSSFEEPLTFTLAVRGNLRPRISSDGRNVTFVNEAGVAVVNYNGLTVFDATGTGVPAWFEAIDGSDGRDTRITYNHSYGRDAHTTQETPPAYAGVTAKLLRLVVDDSEAVYPLTIDPIAQQAYLKASNTGAGDQFGYSVAVSGDTVVVGARWEDSSATGVDGNQADNSATNSGAAYVFVRDAGGVWTQQAYLKASNTELGDEFGFSVAVSGDTVVVGAYLESSSSTGVNSNQADNSAPTSGAAYVFVRDGNSVWSQQAYLKASNTGGGDNFGFSVAISGDTVVIGAPFEDSSVTGVNGNQSNNNATQSGAAYVFVRSGGIWSQHAYLKASNTGESDFFGYSVAVSGDTVVVGAYLEDSSATGVDGDQGNNNALDSGAAYIFVRDGNGVWSQQAYLKASNTRFGDTFGRSVAASGDTVVVGAPQEASSATGVNGNQADNSAIDSGAAYIFVRNGGVWTQQAYLKASNTEAIDRFGWSVAVSGDTVVVGAYLEDSIATGVNGDQANNSAGDSGAAYVFIRDGDGVWSQQAYLKASNTGGSDHFGRSVFVSGDTVVVGAYQEDSSATGVNGNEADNSALNSGAAYVFTGLGPDTDGDGVPDSIDGCPNDPMKIAPGACGCGNPDVDTDGDGTADCVDDCPNDPMKIAPGACGCGNPDVDTDSDGIADCVDDCPNDPMKIAPGACGCGNPDVDTDGDGTADCVDDCPNDPNKTDPGACGCGVADTDEDGSGIADCNETSALNPTLSDGLCGCLNCASGTATVLPMLLVGMGFIRRLREKQSRC